MDPTITNFSAMETEERPTLADTDHAFLDPMVENFNNIEVTKRPLMGLTKNFSPTFLTTDNPCLDFFFHVVPNTEPKNMRRHLELAWRQDPLTTLKLICNLRGVRGTGKSDKEGFYVAALWLHENHPKTLVCNLRSFAEFGYFKDLPEILYRLLEGNIRMNIINKRRENEDKSAVPCEEKISKTLKKLLEGNIRMNIINKRREKEDKSTVPCEEKISKELKKSISREERISEEAKKMEVLKEKARELRHEKRAAMTKKAIDKYVHDPNYRYLHDKVSDVFAESLIADLQYLNSGELHKISLASKWCPSLGSSFDRSTLLCESIAKKVFPRELHSEYEGTEEAHYVHKVRDRLRKQVLVPLRQALELPEIYITSNRWSLLPYERVPSVAMKTYKRLFFKHDGLRFKEYLSKVTKGEAKIAAGALLPHEIIASICSNDEENDEDQVAELQWTRMVEDLSKKGKLKNSLSICDVSGSMWGTPMEVAIAFGILTSELNEDPWKGKLITFSDEPQLHSIQGENLRAKVKFVEEMDCCLNTNFQKAFDLILQMAIDKNLSEEQMIKQVFVFSDMEFDQASENPWATDYDVICKKFRENGNRKVPKIVFWNLAYSESTPVLGTQRGVALVSGYSKNLLTLFIDGDGIVDPEAVMKLAIAGPEYLKLLVCD